MRSPFIWLMLALAALYVLTASNAVEFNPKTLESTGAVDRVAFKPTFHMDRLTDYIEQRWLDLKHLAAKVSR